jgi:hypothetical protein
MNHIIGAILPIAVGVAISPIPIIAIIVMLQAPDARKVGPAFALGWMGTLAAISTIVALAAGVMNVGNGGGPGTLATLLLLVIGVLLLVLAYREWKSRPAAGVAGPTPHWMETVDSLPPKDAAGIAALLAGVNPKNLALAIAAGVAISENGANIVSGLLGVIIFVLIASCTILAPLAVYFLRGASAEATLGGWKKSMSENNAVIMAVLLTIIGVVLIAKGLEGLL